MLELFLLIEGHLLTALCLALSRRRLGLARRYLGLPVFVEAAVMIDQDLPPPDAKKP